MLNWSPYFFVFVVFKTNVDALKRGDTCLDGVSVCATVSECPSIVAQIKKGVKPYVCGVESSKVVLCCPHPTLIRSTTRKPFAGKAKITAATKYCNRYNPGLCSSRSISIPNSPFKPVIAGGSPSYPKQFPHMALIGYGKILSDVHWLCGGSLISEFYVLTAAHCVRSSLGNAHWVRLGEHDLDSKSDDANIQDFVITDRVIHPDYKPPSLYNDIALLKLDRAAKFDDYVRPLCLQENQNYTPTQLIASGWGTTGYGETTSSIMLHVNLSLIDYNTCAKLIQSDNNLSKGVDQSSHICAGYLEGGKDTCTGDSGGPLQYLSSQPGCPNIYHQVGITSFGKGCALKNSPGVYTKVAHYIPWIESIVWD